MLTLTFILLAVVGCGYVMVAAFVGHLTDFGGAHGHGGDAGHADAGGHAADAHYGIEGAGHGSASAHAPASPSFHFPFFSPLALFTLFAAIGGYGLIAQFGLRASDEMSLAIAVPAALATAYGVTYVGWKVIHGSTGSSEIRIADLPGATGEVTTPIPPGALGEVAAVVAGQRYSAPARELDGKAVPRGTSVTVVRMVGSTLVVKAADK